MEQVVNVSRTTVLREAWARGQQVAVHGWVYKVTDGLLRDLGMCMTRHDDRDVIMAPLGAGR
jgi:carbonic anhydrase